MSNRDSESAAAQRWLDVRGLHCHIGSQITDAVPYARAVGVALDLIETAERAMGRRLEFLNAGGGFAVPYRRVVPGAVCDAADYFCSTVQPDDYAAAICDTLRRRRPDLKLFLEPGPRLPPTPPSWSPGLRTRRSSGCATSTAT